MSCSSFNSNHQQLFLHRFDPCSIRNYSTVLFAGGRGTGKSFCARDFLWHLRSRIYDAIAFTGSHEDEFPLERYFGAENTMRGFDEGRLEEFIETQERRKAVVADYNQRMGTKIECPQSIAYFEDLEYLKKKIWTHESVRALWFNGRHSKTMAFCLFQYLMEIPLGLRGMFDYAVFAIEPNIAVRERVWKQFGGACPMFPLFDTIMRTCTRTIGDRNMGLLVVDCRSRSYNLDEAFFWYRATEHGEFHVGYKSDGAPAAPPPPPADDDLLVEF
jgi:hypothetical protein